MRDWRENAYFKRNHEGHLFRASPYRAGYVVTEAEKHRLLPEIKRFDRNFAGWGLLLAAVLAVPTVTGVVKIGMSAPTFAFLGVLAGGGLFIFWRHLQHRTATRVLGDRQPDTPAPGFREAMTSGPAHLSNPRVMIPRLWIGAIAGGLSIVAIDVGVFILVDFAAIGSDTGGPAQIAALVSDYGFWLGVAGFNVIIIGCTIFSIYRLRHFRAMTRG